MTTLSSQAIQRGIDAAHRDLADARAEHARCAYEHAADRTDEAKRQAVIKALERLDVLNAELQGLEAAKAEAQRREAQADADELDRQRLQHLDNALRAITACTKAAEDAAKALTVAGERRAVLFGLYDQARTECKRALRGVESSRADFVTGPFNDDQLDHLWRGLLQHTGVVPWETFEIRQDEAAGALEWISGNAERIAAFIERHRGAID